MRVYTRVSSVGM
uniref:Uncharacterized protein n=1 Tax=Rhizophora mucronata TaxID=61149 RepID=A0A2P2ITA8_RHIMU